MVGRTLPVVPELVDRIDPELITCAQKHSGISVFTGVGEHTREGNDLCDERIRRYRKSSHVGQMNGPPGARMRVALTGLTVRYFRDVEGQDVLLFIDNIFRSHKLVQKYLPFAGAYTFSPLVINQPHSKWVNCRNVSSTEGFCNLYQAIYVPADDYDPAPAAAQLTWTQQLAWNVSGSNWGFTLLR